MATSGMAGAQIRSFRLKKRISISELARRSGVSKSLISQLEREGVNTSIDTLRSIASALQVPLFTLFIDHDDSYKTVVRKNERIALHEPGSDTVRELLTPNMQQAVLLVIGKIPAGASTSPTPTTHKGEVGIFVLRGCLTVELGDDTYVMEEGDTLYFDARVPHRLTNAGQTETEILSAVTPPGL